MLAKHSLLVSVFAGGCLSGAALIALVHEDRRTVTGGMSEAHRAESHPYETSLDSADGGSESSDIEHPADAESSRQPPPTPKIAEVAEEHAADAGSSVADILNRLEAAYLRDQNLEAAPRAAAPPQTPPRELAPHEETAVAAIASSPPAAQAAAATAAGPVAAPRTAEPEPVTSETAGRPLVASRDEAPRDVYVGDVQQNTNVASVQQGDVYVIQHVIPYVPYFPYAAYASTPSARPAMPGYPAPAVHFRSSLTNPDSPFKYPVDLVH